METISNKFYDDKNLKLYDDNGNEITKEEYDAQRQEFENAYKRKYEEIVNQIVAQINSRCKTDKQKLRMLFDFLTSDDMKFEMRGTANMASGQLGTPCFQYEFPPYKRWGIDSGSKYAVILNHAGVCKSYSEAFEDICKRLDIPCMTVTGNTGMGHSWIVVKEKDTIKHIDVGYAVMRNRKDKYNYFMKTFDELQRVAGRRTVDVSLEDIKNELQPINNFVVENRTDRSHSKFKIIDRTDTPGL